MTAEQIGLQTLWSLVQGAPLSIFAVDQKGKVLVWNQNCWGQVSTLDIYQPIRLHNFPNCPPMSNVET